MDHPFHKLIKREAPTHLQQIVIAAIIDLSTKQPYSGMTFEEIYDALLAKYDEHFAFRAVPA